MRRRDYADKRFLHESAPAALFVYIAVLAIAAFFGYSVAEWWTGSDIISGAIDCMVTR